MRAFARLILNGRGKTSVGVSRSLNFKKEDKVSSHKFRRNLNEQDLKLIKKKKRRLLKSH